MGQISGGDVDVKSISAGTTVIGKFGIDQTTPGTTNGVQVNAALPAGTNTIGATTGATTTTNLTATSPASASTAVGATITGLGLYRSLNIMATLTGATGGVLDVYLQVSPDAGTTWVDYVHFAQLSAGAAAVTKAITVSRNGQQTTITAVGTGTTPALAANTVVGGDFTDRMRVLFVAGVSTSAGAAQTILITASS